MKIRMKLSRSGPVSLWRNRNLIWQLIQRELSQRYRGSYLGFLWSILLLPLAYLPLIFLCLAIGWTLASLGVFIRDLSQGIPIVIQVIFFMSPIVYSLEMVPENLRPILQVNPLTIIIDGFRQVILWGGSLPWVSWSIVTLLMGLLAALGYFWFERTKKGFADVV
jgi:lipopolysaccharide transport system permease protein